APPAAAVAGTQPCASTGPAPAPAVAGIGGTVWPDGAPCTVGSTCVSTRSPDQSSSAPQEEQKPSREGALFPHSRHRIMIRLRRFSPPADGPGAAGAYPR